MIEARPLETTVPFVLLEDRLTPGARPLLFTKPQAIIRADSLDDIDAALQQIDAAGKAGLFVAGWISYEFGYALEARLRALMPTNSAGPLLWLGCFKAPQQLESDQLDRFWARCRLPKPIEQLAPGWDKGQHSEAVGKVLEYIKAGDVYQVNLTFPLRFQFDGDPLPLYAALRAAQPAAHSALIVTDEMSLLSASPELFVEANAGKATTRPMKGTTARGKDSREDAKAVIQLQSDPKQQAENLMIVDLLRNDLSRISEIGSAKVPALFTVETYPTLHTLTSTITSLLRPDVSATDLLRAMFPCGSVTGAPKIRAMEIIRELEGRPRGAYTGSIGAISPSGDLRFNVAIRTALLQPTGEGVYGIGGGIVAESNPAAEYDECLLKARVLTEFSNDYRLIETLRWSADRSFLRLALHLDRLTNSARHLDFKFDAIHLTEELRTVAASFPSLEDQRVRIELHRNGDTKVTWSPLPTQIDGPTVKVAIALDRADPGNPFLQHKTTKRASYEAAQAQATAQGADDALFLNRNGFVTETTRSSVFLDQGSILLTPRLDHGLLPGVLRRELIEAGRAREADLRLQDIVDANHWFVGNSLRGLQKAVISIG